MSAEAVQAVAEALRVHRTDEIMAECLCGWESPHGREMRTTHCLNHQAEAILAAARPAIEREAKAAAWDEGFDAGHQAARAVNPEWPEQPTNPYRIEREGQA